MNLRSVRFLTVLLALGFPALSHLALAGTITRSAPRNDPEASETAPPPSRPAPPSYSQAMARIFNPTALKEFIKVSDALIDQADPANGPRKSLQMETDSGVLLQFSSIENELATMYYLSVSRKGEELHYSEAVKLAALFADRVGLTHPITVKEGEKPVFYCEWLIKPGDWKKFRKMMLQEREKNRKILDPVKALNVAISRELEARTVTPRS